MNAPQNRSHNFIHKAKNRKSLRSPTLPNANTRKEQSAKPSMLRSLRFTISVPLTPPSPRRPFTYTCHAQHNHHLQLLTHVTEQPQLSLLGQATQIIRQEHSNHVRRLHVDELVIPQRQQPLHPSTPSSAACVHCDINYLLLQTSLVENSPLIPKLILPVRIIYTRIPQLFLYYSALFCYQIAHPHPSISRPTEICYRGRTRYYRQQRAVRRPVLRNSIRMWQRGRLVSP
jgi:hypothetical protein